MRLPVKTFETMGLIMDTPNVRKIEQRYHCELVAYEACWDEDFRTYVFDGQYWRGVYPLKQEDFQVEA